MRRHYNLIAALGLAAWLFPSAATAAISQDPPAAPDTATITSRETYLLRLENSKFGAIEVSVDRGEHFQLIGRVVKPAVVAAPDRVAALAGSVARSGGEGIALEVAPNQVIKLLPAGAIAPEKAPVSAIVTDIKPRTSLFGEFVPPAGTPLLQQLGRAQWQPLPGAYMIAEDDVLGMRVSLPDKVLGVQVPEAPDAAYLARLADTRKRLSAESEQYTAQALGRAQASKRPVVSGIVRLHAKLPSGEPEPITAVTYRIDGDIVSAQNTFPAEFGWDSRRVPNGEHVIEVRALSRYATTVTRLRTLVVVNNP